LALGLLEVSGSLDLTQFWPSGGSDADTSKIRVEVGAGAFRFRPHPGAAWQTTNVFDDATVIGKARYPAVRNGQVTVRLQGLDAPELHYRPDAALKKADQSAEQRELYLEWNLEYRQYMAETATIAVSQFLNSAGGAALDCTVRSLVDEPSEVFDTYGRMVGDIWVDVGAGEVDLNHWIVEQGWAFPAFYSSMSPEEIAAFTERGNDAWSNSRGVWPLLNEMARAADFEFDLEYRGKNAAPDPAADRAGLIVLPKLFRRLATYRVNKRAKMVTGSFETYLRSKRSSDGVHLTEEFVAQGASAAPVRYLDEFVEGGQVTVWPEQLVYREKPSRVVGPGGATILSF
jgi:endonuclease YncB( thermonuclease family)